MFCEVSGEEPWAKAASDCVPARTTRVLPTAGVRCDAVRALALTQTRTRVCLADDVPVREICHRRIRHLLCRSRDWPQSPRPRRRALGRSHRSNRAAAGHSGRSQRTVRRIPRLPRARRRQRSCCSPCLRGPSRSRTTSVRQAAAARAARLPPLAAQLPGSTPPDRQYHSPCSQPPTCPQRRSSHPRHPRCSTRRAACLPAAHSGRPQRGHRSNMGCRA
jgi:hypothetical protein